ncbi:MAG: hypothetical protein R3237_01755 [Nitrosopumilaceae archaeon]|nr:hypothetical protein [Nitrosopumilaceae archaeon]
MHCDDKRTIFALNQKLQEAKEEKVTLIRKITNEKNSIKKPQLEKKLSEIEKFIIELQNQLSETK